MSGGAGQAEGEQAAEVDGGGPQVQPAVVLVGAAVGHSAVAAGQPGDAAFGHGSVLPVDGLKAWVGGAGAVGAGQGVVLGQHDGAPVVTAGAASAQRAAGAAVAEVGGPLDRGDGDGVPGRAGSVPAAWSRTKSAVLNPPGMSECAGQGLITAVCPAAAGAASIGPVP